MYKNYGKERCTSHAIGWKTLNQLVLEDIRRNARVASLAEEDYVNMLVSMKTEKKAQEINRCKRELPDKLVVNIHFLTFDTILVHLFLMYHNYLN